MALVIVPCSATRAPMKATAGCAVRCGAGPSAVSSNFSAPAARRARGAGSRVTAAAGRGFARRLAARLARGRGPRPRARVASRLSARAPGASPWTTYERWGGSMTLAYRALSGGGVCARVDDRGRRPERARCVRPSSLNAFMARARASGRRRPARVGERARPRGRRAGHAVRGRRLGRLLLVAASRHQPGPEFRPDSDRCCQLAVSAGRYYGRRHRGARRDTHRRPSARPPGPTYGPSTRLDIELELGS